MKVRGRPLRFLLSVLGCWIGLRGVMLWPVTTLPQLPAGLLASRSAAPAVTPARADVPEFKPAPPGILAAARPRTRSPQVALAALPRPDADRIMLALFGFVSVGQPRPVQVATFDYAPPTEPSIGRPPADGPNRWSGSGWAILRASGGASALSGTQLGGSQAGLRLAYLLDPSRRIALAARFVTPIEGRGREAAVGVEWQPTRLPVRIVAEQRIAIDPGGGGQAIGVVGGAGPLPILGFRLEGYGQAGVIRRREVVGYADGSLRLEHPVARYGRADVTLGGGAWGAAQTGTGRLDIGPTLAVRVPAVGTVVRMNLDWRERVLGDARPGSGLALSIGSDF